MFREAVLQHPRDDELRVSHIRLAGFLWKLREQREINRVPNRLPDRAVFPSGGWAALAEDVIALDSQWRFEGNSDRF